MKLIRKALGALMLALCGLAGSALPAATLAGSGKDEYAVKAQLLVELADYVPKPFHVEEVLARVEHQLRILALRRDLLTQNAALLEANLKLQEIDQLKASFTAMLVHDLRSPLGRSAWWCRRSSNPARWTPTCSACAPSTSTRPSQS